MLDPGLTMAAEFRNRGWFRTEAAARELCGWLGEAGIVLVAADELRHETFQRDKHQTGRGAAPVLDPV